MHDEGRAVAVKRLLTLFTLDRKRSLETYARSLVIHTGAFADVVIACQRGLLPLRHRAHSDHVAPSRLIPSRDELQALARNERGPLQPVPRKALRKLRELTRSWSAGHMFYTAGLYEWHFFAFDARDQDPSNANHWTHGAHVHFVNWLWPRLDPDEMWTAFVKNGTKPGAALHIRDDLGAA
jgi:hypothetical protein